MDTNELMIDIYDLSKQSLKRLSSDIFPKSSQSNRSILPWGERVDSVSRFGLNHRRDQAHPVAIA